jgi:hypothetical protein
MMKKSVLSDIKIVIIPHKQKDVEKLQISHQNYIFL